MGVAVVTAVFAFAYRYFSHNDFANNHFVHLARAQAMLLGDLPVRDYTEEGVPLTVALSAVFQALVGPSPFAELLFAVMSFAAAAAATYWVAVRLTGFRTLGFLAAALQILAAPRLNGHPKMLVYPVFMLLAVRYVERPHVRRLALLAGWTAIAFLLRHDHGVYLGLAAATVILLTHWRDGIRMIARASVAYGAILALCLAPYMIYVQWQLGIVNYFRVGIGMSRKEPRQVFAWPFEWKAGPVVMRLPTDPMDLPGIHVRWRPTVTAETRKRDEAEVGLLAPEPQDDPYTWTYHVDPDATDTLTRLAALTDVEDFSGFNRTTLAFTDEPGFLTRFVRRYRLNRIRFGPGITSATTQGNAITVVFALVRLLPIAAFLFWWFRRDRLKRVDSSAVVGALCVLSFVCGLGLARQLIGYRVADTFGTFPLVAMWFVAAGFELRGTHHVGRRVRTALLVAGLSAIAFAVCLMGDAPTTLAQTGIVNVSRLPARAHAIFERGTQWPWSREWPGEDDWQVARYVRECTSPGDRLLVTWFAPEFNYFSQRVFAGGETTLMPPRRPPESFESQVLDRLQRQNVPIVLQEAQNAVEFAETYPALAAYINAKYRMAGDVDFGSNHHILVSVDRVRAQTGVDRTFGFPCFVSGGPAPRS